MASEVIFENSHYAACAMSDGSLVVTGKRRQPAKPGYGSRLIGPTALHWADNIRSAVAEGDTAEASMLCRALMPAPSSYIRR